ncbi:MAG: hypothetical protein IJS70_09480 [Bacteroidales bacterium]|nr:hypothetical protein [Bacteroidales bacterium]MBQ7459386.1 hypothetical protein [Bacteroidales bacterium]
MMRRSDLQREENYNEYLRLLQNDDYLGVTYDEVSGGVSAVHKYHQFDKQKGAFGIRRGDYERIVVNVLRNEGHRIVLESEMSVQGIKKCDGLLDDIPMEIKSIEGRGTWTISTKLLEAEKQHAKCVVLFFPKADLYSDFRVIEGLRLFFSCPKRENQLKLSRLLVIVENRLVTDI